MWFQKKSKLIVFFSLLAERHWPSPVSKTSQNYKTRKFYTYSTVAWCAVHLLFIHHLVETLIQFQAWV